MVGNGQRVKLWVDRWCGDTPLYLAFLVVFAIASSKEVWSEIETLCIFFWLVRKVRNGIFFRDEVFSIQKVKLFFVPLVGDQNVYSGWSFDCSSIH